MHCYHCTTRGMIGTHYMHNHMRVPHLTYVFPKPRHIPKHALFPLLNLRLTLTQITLRKGEMFRSHDIAIINVPPHCTARKDHAMAWVDS